MSNEGPVAPSEDNNRGPRLQFLGMSVLAAILAWTVVVGVGRAIGPVRFTYFSAEWGLYFGVVGLLYGYQQEVTRLIASNRHEPHRAVHNRRPKVPLGLAGTIFVATYLLANFFLDNPHGEPFLTPLILAIGCASYVFLVHMNGVLAGLGLWRALAFSVVGDSLLRFGAIWLVLRFASDYALPLGIVSGGLIWIALSIRREYRSALAHGTTGPMGHRIVSSMMIAGCSAILVSGFPFLAVSSSGDRIDAMLGSALAAIAVIRAPVMVAAGPISVLIMERTAKGTARNQTAIRGWRTAILALLIVGTLASFAFGPPALSMLFSSSYTISRGIAAAAFVSSALVALLIGTGTVLMAKDRHILSISGWIITLLATVIALGSGLENEQRLVVSLLMPPALGSSLHLLFISRLHTSHPRS